MGDGVVCELGAGRSAVYDPTCIHAYKRALENRSVHNLHTLFTTLHSTLAMLDEEANNIGAMMGSFGASLDAARKKMGDILSSFLEGLAKWFAGWFTAAPEESEGGRELEAERANREMQSAEATRAAEAHAAASRHQAEKMKNEASKMKEATCSDGLGGADKILARLAGLQPEPVKEKDVCYTQSLQKANAGWYKYYGSECKHYQKQAKAGKIKFQVDAPKGQEYFDIKRGKKMPPAN